LSESRPQQSGGFFSFCAAARVLRLAAFDQAKLRGLPAALNGAIKLLIEGGL